MIGIFDLIKGLPGRLITVFKVGAAALVARVLGAFGLTMVTFNGILPSLKAYLSSYINAIPTQAQEFLGALGMDIFFTMIVSALTVRLAWKVMFIPKTVAANLPGGTP